MSVGELCNPEVVATEAGTSVAEAARVMRNFHVGTLVVVARDATATRPVGLITDRDIVIEVLAAGLDPDELTVGDIMTRELETIAESADLWEAIARMRDTGVRRLPVLDARGSLAGILTLDDALSVIGQGLLDLTTIVDREIHYEQRTRGG